MHGRAIDGTIPEPLETVVATLAAATRYDILLGIIPVAFAIGLVVASVTGIALVHTLLVASLVGVLVLVDACYLNPPVEQRSA